MSACRSCRAPHPLRRVTHMSGTPSALAQGAHERRAGADSIRGTFVCQARSSIRRCSTIYGRRFPPQSSAMPTRPPKQALASPSMMVSKVFPAHSRGHAGPVEMKVVDGSLHIRSSRAALCYVGKDAPALLGFGRLRRQRRHRRAAWRTVLLRWPAWRIINVGGLKVHPEEVEAAGQRASGCLMSRAKALGRSRSLAPSLSPKWFQGPDATENASALKNEIMAACRSKLRPTRFRP